MPSNVLTRDPITVPGQKYALVSFVGPTLSQKADKFGLKIRGCFNTPEEAQAHVKQLIDADPLFDVYLVNMYEWLLIPPDNSKIEDSHYQEEYLEKLIQGYKHNQSEAKKLFEQRKLDVMRDGIDKHLTGDERLPTPSFLLEAMQSNVPSSSSSSSAAAPAPASGSGSSAEEASGSGAAEASGSA
jgi:Family of unknown function (DUF5832)